MPDVRDSRLGALLGEIDHYIEEGILFEEFCGEVRKLVDEKAKAKGYNETGVAGCNPLMEFTEKFCNGHASGEIIYKVIRYQSRKDPEDLCKIAAWAYLLWKQHGKSHQ